MLSFSIVINTYNRAQSLRQTLEGISALAYPLFEIVVVNGPSDDETEAVLSEHVGRIKILKLAERNLSKSRNLGIAAASGDIVAFIDDDAYPDPAWLDRLAEGYDHAEIGAVGGPTYDRTGYILQTHYNVTNRLGDSWAKGPESPNPTDLLCRPFSMWFPSLLGTNSSFRRATLLEIGGFDEEFDYHLDETDVCIRLIDRGYVVRLLDDGYVYHKFLASHLRTPMGVLRDRFSIIKNRVYFSLKHGMPHLSFFDICRDLSRFVEEHRKDYRSNVSRGLLSETDFRKFEVDIHQAFNAGLERFTSNEVRNRPERWFHENGMPFLPYTTVRPAKKLHLCFFSMEYEPVAINGISRFTHEMAVGLAGRGHHIHVLTLGSDHHRVDLEEKVWVHRVAPSARTGTKQPAIRADMWGHSVAFYDEALRIHRHKPLDLLQVPLWDSQGAAVIMGAALPIILSIHTPLRIDPHRGENSKALETRVEPLRVLERFCLEPNHGRNSTEIYERGFSRARTIDAAEQFYGRLLDENRASPDEACIATTETA